MGEVFLVSRMQEEYVHGAHPTEEIVAGFRHGARVVTAAAIIMISVFAGFLLDDVALVKSIGMGLASAVLFDAFVVLPAAMTLLGYRAWPFPPGSIASCPTSTSKGGSCGTPWQPATRVPRPRPFGSRELVASALARYNPRRTSPAPRTRGPQRRPPTQPPWSAGGPAARTAKGTHDDRAESSHPRRTGRRSSPWSQV
ncbi:MMPL family transporter [Streptomyces sp. NBC_01602]|uniref:MMPL family transporter n=1 Tax=Streptomyces sp. NBC_01602 TaxID=2975893 RepID=UPI003868F9A9|nr:MMPL family transporter [Streptomyces sp. NBC_01602]